MGAMRSPMSPFQRIMDMSQDKNEHLEKVAVFRFGIIADLKDLPRGSFEIAKCLKLDVQVFAANTSNTGDFSDR